MTTVPKYQIGQEVVVEAGNQAGVIEDIKVSDVTGRTLCFVIDEAVKPWLSPLEAKLLHDALYDMVYRVLTGDKLVQHRSESDVIAVENILKDIDLGE